MAIYTTRSKRFRVGAYSMLLCAAVTVLVLLANLILGALPTAWTQFDTSTTGYYDIGEASVSYLQALDEDVSLYLIAETNAEDIIISTLLTRVAACSSHIHLSQIDPALYPTFAAQYTSETPEKNTVIVVSERRSTVLSYSDFFYSSLRAVEENETLNANLSYRQDEDGKIYEVTSHYAGEASILSAIDYVVSETIAKVYRLTGHGESALENTYLERLNLENIKPASQTISLLTSTSIPDDCSLMMILYPTTDFSTVEIGFLRSYLNRGGRMMLMTSYGTKLPNLFSLLEEYGMGYYDGVVLESSAANYLQYPFYIMPTIDASLTDKPLLVAAHAITLSEASNTSVRLKALYTSSKSSYLKDPGDLQTTVEKGTDDPLGPFCLGALAENEKTGGAICWISARFFAHSDCDSMTGGANLEAFLSLAGRMTERENAIPISIKTLDSGLLAIGSSSVKHFWGILLIGVLPVGMMLLGLLIWYRRRKR